MSIQGSRPPILPGGCAIPPPHVIPPPLEKAVLGGVPVEAKGSFFQNLMPGGPRSGGQLTLSVTAQPEGCFPVVNLKPGSVQVFGPNGRPLALDSFEKSTTTIDPSGWSYTSHVRLAEPLVPREKYFAIASLNVNGEYGAIRTRAQNPNVAY